MSDFSQPPSDFADELASSGWLIPVFLGGADPESLEHFAQPKHGLTFALKSMTVNGLAVTVRLYADHVKSLLFTVG